MMKLDIWQKEIKAYSGNILLGKGRRIGATYIMGEKAVDHLATNYNSHPTSQIVCVSITEDQAQLIIAFATNYAAKKYPKLIGRGKYKPTMKSLTLVVNGNARQLLAKPVGATGDSVRGFEGQILMVDEAPKMPKLFWESARPILATTGGKIWMWGTFFGKDNYFYEQYDKCRDNDKGRYKVWEMTTEDVFNNRPLSKDWTLKQRKEGIQFLKDEKEDMTKLVYAQEYLAIASANLRQVFPDDLLAEICVLTEKGKPQPNRDYFLGVDVAGMGRDISSYESLDGTHINQIKQVDHQITSRTKTTQVTKKILDLNNTWDYNKIGVDGGGLGFGVWSELSIEDDVKRIVVDLNNASRPVDSKGVKSKKLLKEEMYNNLLILMEKHHIQLLKDTELILSLKSVQFEIIDNKAKYFGRDTHIAEGLIRAAWLIKTKGLNLWAYYS